MPVFYAGFPAFFPVRPPTVLDSFQKILRFFNELLLKFSEERAVIKLTTQNFFMLCKICLRFLKSNKPSSALINVFATPEFLSDVYIKTYMNEKIPSMKNV